MTREEAAAEIARRLVEHYRPERVYLFGSSARGDYRQDSDLDICAVFPDDAHEEIFRGPDFNVGYFEYPKQIVVFRGRDFNARALRVVASLPATIVREGKLLYDSETLLMDEIRAWSRKADDDLVGARSVLPVERFAVVLFLCQQAAEKALKAFLTFHQQPFEKTHELSTFGKQCLAIDASLAEVASKAAELEKYAVKYRYPGAPYEPDAVEANSGIENAEFVLREIERRLPKQ
jgi:HEPN domain-containing protein